jgi:lauroyl/myristoyl acyltransferase
MAAAWAHMPLGDAGEDLPGGVRLVETPPAAPLPGPPISRRDLREALLQGMLLAGAVLLPPSAWPGLCRLTSRVRRRKHRRQLPQLAERFRALLGPEVDAEALFAAYREVLHRRRLVLFREMLGRSGAGHRVIGLDHLHRALAAGRGAVLWAAPFAYQGIDGKRALAEAGIRAWQVSVREHGFLGTPFAVAVLNPPLWRVEERFLAGRLVFDPAAPGEIGPRMRAVLRARGVLLVTNNALAGRRMLAVPLAPGFRLPMASGPLRLARAHGAPVLPCATIARGAFGPYELLIGPPLPLAGKDERAALAAAALATRDHLLPCVQDAPEQFLGWTRLLPEAAPSGVPAPPATAVAADAPSDTPNTQA